MSAKPDRIARLERAFESRDLRFDGLFFAAVAGRAVYCRPACCRARPKASKLRFFQSAAQCEAQGFRPCEHCAPELAPAARPRIKDELVARAFQRIANGYLESSSSAELAKALGVSTHQLRTRFRQSLGITPTQLHRSQKLRLARILLRESTLSLEAVARASGFSSERGLKSSYLRTYGRALKQGSRPAASGIHAPLRLRLRARPPFDYASILTWLESRLLRGIECIEDGAYLRVLGDAGKGRSSWLRVYLDPKDPNVLMVELHGVNGRDLPKILRRLRAVFDLDADPMAIHAALGQDPRLAPLIQKMPGLRIPGSWSGYETAIRAIIGQQISVKGANTIAQRLVARCAQALEKPPHPALTHRFISPRAMLRANLDGLGLTGARIRSVRAVSQALSEKSLGFELDGPVEEWIEAWTELPGIGEWTATYLALRTLAHPDLFPHGDLVLRKALSEDPSQPLTGAKARLQALRWSPWRSYAAFLLWNNASLSP